MYLTLFYCIDGAFKEKDETVPFWNVFAVGDIETMDKSVV